MTNDLTNQLCKIFDLTSWFVTWGQKGGEIYLSPWNHKRCLSPWRTHNVDYFFSFWWSNQEPLQEAVNVELLKPTTSKNFIFMPFLDKNSHLTTKPYNFDIKCQCNSESYDQHAFFGTRFRGVRIVHLRWEAFSTRESTLGLTCWTSS